MGGLVSLRGRGAFSGEGIDLQLALVPVVLALVLVVALIRVLPALLLRATRWARRSSGVVPLVALARAGAQSGAAALALLVLVLAMGSGVFGGMVARSLEGSRAQSADWRTGGAPTALVGPRARLPEDLSQVRTVGRQVLVTGASGELTAQESGATVPSAELVALDADALRAAVPTSPLAAALTAAREAGPAEDGTASDGTASDGTASAAGSGAAERVWTALADPALARSFPDEVLEVAAFGTTNFRVRVVGALPPAALRDPVLGPVLGSERAPAALLVFTDPSAQRQLPTTGGHPSALLLHPADGGPPVDRSAVSAAAAGALAPGGVVGPAVELRAHEQELAVLRGDGLARSLRLAFRLTTGTALLLALGAVALELVLSSAERARTTSYLRTLGLGGASLTALQLLQLLPLFAASAIGGTALGAVLPAALGPGLELRALTGGPFEPAVQVDWTTTAVLGTALAALLLGAAALEAAIVRRRGLGAVLRLGEAL
ncbi:hypothetical protein [Kitasatospora sp. NPDC004289]